MLGVGAPSHLNPGTRESWRGKRPRRERENVKLQGTVSRSSGHSRFKSARPTVCPAHIRTPREITHSLPPTS
jgi:hypothetical protein